MRVRTLLCAFLGLLLLTGACSSGGTPQEPASNEPAEQDTGGDDGATENTAAGPTPATAATTFTTGDLENLVMAPDQAPQGMKPGEPGVASAYGSGTVEQNAKIAGHGFVLYRTQVFSTPSSLVGAKLPKVGELGFYSLASSASVYEDAVGAAEHFDDPSPPGDAQKDYERQPLDAELGEDAVRVSWREKSNFGGTVPFVQLGWVRGNARFALGGYGVNASEIDEDALLALAQDLDAAAEGGAPPLELPEFTGTGQVVLNEQFGDPSSGWKEAEFSDASAAYDSGRWVMSIDGGGFVASAAEADKSVADLHDVRLQFDAKAVSEEGEFGAVCRYGAKQQRYYVGTIGATGSVDIGYVSGGKNSTYEALAGVTGADVGKTSHEVQMDCVGKDIVRIQVRLDGEIVAEAIDLAASLAAGAPGLYVGVGEGHAEAAFDNLKISQP